MELRQNEIVTLDEKNSSSIREKASPADERESSPASVEYLQCLTELRKLSLEIDSLQSDPDGEIITARRDAEIALSRLVAARTIIQEACKTMSNPQLSIFDRISESRRVSAVKAKGIEVFTQALAEIAKLEQDDTVSPVDWRFFAPYEINSDIPVGQVSEMVKPIKDVINTVKAAREQLREFVKTAVEHRQKSLDEFADLVKEVQTFLDKLKASQPVSVLNILEDVAKLQMCQ